nr:MAG: putative RNA-dependent RNA polymerase [Mitoviridae sp.]
MIKRYYRHVFLNRPTISASVFTPFNLPYALFSSTTPMLRKYEVWVALAKRHGFSQTEVLEASALGAFVVVDPMNKSSLLALTPMAYQKLLGQTMATENLNLVLLLSPLDELAPSAAGASTKGNQNSPTWIKKISLDLESLTQKITEGRYNKGQRSSTWARGYPFQGYQGLGSSLSDGRLVLQSPGIFQAIFQRFATRLAFWGALSRTRRFRSSLYLVTIHLTRVLKHSGPLGLALYLKASYITVLRFISGQRYKFAFEETGVPLGLANGLPHYLPREWRYAIRRGSPVLTRIVLSLLYSYKAFKASKAKSLNEIIVNILKPSLTSLPNCVSFSQFVHEFLHARTSPISPGELNPPGLPASVKAGPCGPLAALAYGADAFAWVQREGDPVQPQMPGPFEWFRLFELDKWDKKVRNWAGWFLDRGFNHEFSVTFPPPTKSGWLRLKTRLALGLNVPESKSIELKPSIAFTRRTVSYSPVRVEDMQVLKAAAMHLPVGRIHVLWEAAGKTRVIAMMDGIRQMILKPVHLAMFRRIDKIFGYCSGIKDQSATVRSFAALNNQKVFSYDISAATDSIPYQLYFPQMKFLLGEEGATLWNHLIRGHPFYHLEGNPDDPWPYRYLASLQDVRYHRGQPMGGYSSFAALDLLHHLIIQYSAFESGVDVLNETFSNYRILGDDVVIGDETVANTYLNFMKEWNIPISETKSLVSKVGVFQFLSEVFKESLCLSPISLKADFQAVTFLSRFGFAAEAIRRGWASSRAVEGFGRLILSKDQFVSEIQRVREGRSSSFCYSLLYALATFIGGGWDLGKWLHNVVAHDPCPQLRGTEEDLSPSQESFIFVIIRQHLFTEANRIARLQKEEAGVDQTRQFLDFGQLEFHNSIENDVNSLWLLAREGKALLERAEVTQEWVAEAFKYIKNTVGIIPKLSATGVVHPLDYLVLQKTTDDRNNTKKVSAWSIKEEPNEDIVRQLLLDQTFSLLKSNPYYYEVLNETSSPYGLAVMPVPEEGRPSGSS